MALIDCPECTHEVSDRAAACPHCGFPISDEIERALAEVSGVAHTRSARQKAAATKLQNWAKTYAEAEPADGVPRRQPKIEPFIDRHRRLILTTVVLVVVILQLILLSSVYR